MSSMSQEGLRDNAVDVLTNLPVLYAAITTVTLETSLQPPAIDLHPPPRRAPSLRRRPLQGPSGRRSPRKEKIVIIVVAAPIRSRYRRRSSTTHPASRCCADGPRASGETPIAVRPLCHLMAVEDQPALCADGFGDQCRDLCTIDSRVLQRPGVKPAKSANPRLMPGWPSGRNRSKLPDSAWSR